MAKVVYFLALLQLLHILVTCERPVYETSAERNLELLGCIFARRLLVESGTQQSDVEGELIFSDDQFSQVDKEAESLSEESQELQNADVSNSEMLHKEGHGDQIRFKENVVKTEIKPFSGNKTVIGDKVHPKAETSKKSVNETLLSTTGELEIENTKIYKENAIETEIKPFSGNKTQQKEKNPETSVDETVSSTKGELKSDIESESAESHVDDAGGELASVTEIGNTKNRVHGVWKNKEEIMKGRKGSAWQKEEDVEDKNEMDNNNEMYVVSEEAEEKEVNSDDSDLDTRLVKQNLQDFDDEKIEKGFRRNTQKVSKSKQVQSKKRVNSSKNIQTERKKATKGKVETMATLEETQSSQAIDVINDVQPKEEQVSENQEGESSLETNQISSTESKKKGRLSSTEARNQGSSMRIKKKVPSSSAVDTESKNQIINNGPQSVSAEAKGSNQVVPKEANKKGPLRASVEAKTRNPISDPRSKMDTESDIDKHSETQDKFSEIEDDSPTEEVDTINESDEQGELLDVVKGSSKDNARSSEKVVNYRQENEDEKLEGSQSSSKQNFDVNKDEQSKDYKRSKYQEHLYDIQGKQGQVSEKQEHATSLYTEPIDNITSMEADDKGKKRNEILNPRPKADFVNANTKVETNQTLGEFPEGGIDDFSEDEKVVNEISDEGRLDLSKDDDNAENLMEDFSDLPSKIQATAQTMADHLSPNLQRITNTSKEYFSKANQHIAEGFSPIVGKRFAPFFASLISYGLLLVPLAVVVFLFEHIHTLLPLHKVILFVNVYLAAYFGTLTLVTLVIGEPMSFFYKSSSSGYIQLQLLQALGYVIYLILQSVDVISSCSVEALPIKLTVLSQWVFAIGIGFHYYATVFVRAMLLKPPHTNWKIYGIYCIAFSTLSLFSKVKRMKKVYAQLRHTDTNKSN